MARTALLEGQAMFVLIDYLYAPSGQSLTTNPLLAAPFKVASTDSPQYPVLKNAPFYLKESLSFPYTYGLGFVQELQLKGGREQAFAGALRDPPRNTRDIMTPRSYFSRERIPAFHVPALGPLLGPGYERFDVGTLGQFDVYVMLEQFADGKSAKRLAPAWRGGFYYAARKLPEKDADEAKPAPPAQTAGDPKRRGRSHRRRSRPSRWRWCISRAGIRRRARPSSPPSMGEPCCSATASRRARTGRRRSPRPRRRRAGSGAPTPGRSSSSSAASGCWRWRALTKPPPPGWPTPSWPGRRPFPPSPDGRLAEGPAAQLLPIQRRRHSLYNRRESGVAARPDLPRAGRQGLAGMVFAPARIASASSPAAASSKLSSTSTHSPRCSMNTGPASTSTSGAPAAGLRVSLPCRPRPARSGNARAMFPLEGGNLAALSGESQRER